MDEIIEKKLANALIREAEIGGFGDFLITLAGSSISLVTSAAKKILGGLWVGGTTLLYREKVVFKPNLVNNLIHKEEYVVSIPLKRVQSVSVRFGVLTKIIDIKTSEGVLSVRCFGAKAFAEKIDIQRRAFS